MEVWSCNVARAEHFLGAVQDHYAKAQRRGYKDTYVDLSKLLRWRWKDRGGMQVLTGSRVFTPRPILRPWMQPGQEALHQ
jgi:hypothetical protein